MVEKIFIALLCLLSVFLLRKTCIGKSCLVLETSVNFL